MTQAVIPGLEILLKEHLSLINGRRIGLITHSAGIDRRLRSTIDFLFEHPDAELAALFAPEHGLRGDAQAGEPVPFSRDSGTGLPIHSLYRSVSREAAQDMRDPDARMRETDTQDDGKSLNKPELDTIDLMLCDLQDVGTRVYTYAATMTFAMKACSRAGIPFIVLDRPNPINGLMIEGPMLDPALRSFVGALEVPLRHGLTMGELAQLAAATLDPKPELLVVPMRGWRRHMFFEATGLPWVAPSPNLPTPDSVMVYPGQVLLEGTTLSEGRGTTRPFELFGAPWMDGRAAAEDLNRLELPGVRFREAYFAPGFSKFTGVRCGGCQIHVFESDKLRPVHLTLHIIYWAMNRYPQEFDFHGSYFDHVAGSKALREDLVAGKSPDSITDGFRKGLGLFDKHRKNRLLY